ncbi:hypothetical protein CQY20_04460 [Mycolicibacterium agri]|uniref:N-acetyltransferase domain-containing protein n=1 Tax=Mycolicibacterium agri TaxID=36811 RepID=A0A2A7NE07_MYCAG|nr:hypothetical protein [Mycolicibacterium agri]PEG41708.1 hypothetical protein CQY20_04460 [Mycolicibacterium agri]GFG50063.1 hypothetical protein MAGR_15040 [Mycolicibacterium agri]
MKVPALSTHRPDYSVPLDEGISWFDSDTGCTIVVSTPAADPGLWEDFVDGAVRTYHKHGIERALDMDSLLDEANTQLFHVAVNDRGKVLGGIRAKGPLESAEESHAIEEWADQPGLSAVRKMLTDRLPFGVVEMKTAWMSDDAGRSRSLSDTLARTPFPTMALLDAQFVVATAGAHVLNRWRNSGGVVATKIPATPYPDERYRTKMIWWDRGTFTNHADAKQVSKIFNEMAILSRQLDHVDARALGSGL